MRVGGGLVAVWIFDPHLSCADGEGLCVVGRRLVRAWVWVARGKAIQSLRLAPALRPSAEWQSHSCRKERDEWGTRRRDFQDSPFWTTETRSSIQGLTHE